MKSRNDLPESTQSDFTKVTNHAVVLNGYAVQLSVIVTQRDTEGAQRNTEAKLLSCQR